MEQKWFFQRVWQQCVAILPAETVFFLVVWLLLMWGGRNRLFQDPGTFWHLSWGNQILTTGQIPTVDQFSFTQAGQPVVADQWLTEVLMALVHRLAGWEGLLLVVATGLAWLYGWMGGRLVGAGLHPVWAGAVLAAVFLASAHNFHIRPLIVTFILQAVWFAGLMAVEGGRKPIRYLWLFVPMSVLWSNLHGGVLGGLGTLGFCVVLWILFGLVSRKGPVQSAAQGLEVAAIAAACFTLVLVNPYGLDLPRTWYATLRMNLGQWIQEHQPWHPNEPAGWSAIGLLAIYLILLVGRFRLGQFQASWLMPMVWFLLGMQRVRHLPLFAEIAALTIAELAQAKPTGFLRLEGASESGPSFSHGRPWRKYTIAGLIVGVALGLQWAGWPVPLVGTGWVEFSSERWPVGLLPLLQTTSNCCPEGSSIFNDLDFGGWLIYFTPRWRVFIDDRCALYGEEFLAAYEEARCQRPSQLDQWQQQYGFRWALVQRGSLWDRYLAKHASWQCLGRDQAAAFYRLRSP